jgi:hypothetical protein
VIVAVQMVAVAVNRGFARAKNAIATAAPKMRQAVAQIAAKKNLQGMGMLSLVKWQHVVRDAVISNGSLQINGLGVTYIVIY